MLLYYITDRTQFSGDETSRQSRLLEKIAEAARCGVDYVQLREKDLPGRDLERLAAEALRAIHQNQQLTTGNRQPATALLINSRVDVAIAAGADGVHLRADDISPSEVRVVWRKCSSAHPRVGMSCHSEEDVLAAESHQADFAVFAPVFKKKDSPSTRPAGLERLREACRHKIPVLALGGVTPENAPACLDAGAAGIAGIRLFQENNICDVVKALRE